ncbi:MAG: fimbria/pilus outer membrane usher protein, partial [Deltaproteobacteria bacterium]|nr:fimbria/pilus outer membrane usher protein [Deltaproteobacteria bacterium]
MAASGPARANDDDFSLQDEPGPDGQPMPLEVMLNGQLVGVWICVIKNSDLWLPDAELVKAGITLPKSAHREPGPAGTMVSMFSLGSDASFTLDLKALRAMVLLGKSLLGVHVLDLRAAPRPDNLELQSEFSVFSSYALQADTSRQFNVFTEVGASSGGLVAQTQLSRLQSGLVVRGNSAVTYDDPKHLLAFAMGDSVALAPGAIWGGALLGGLSLRRDRSLDPYGVYSPLPSQQGFAATPSVLDVYVDGALVRSVPVAPGTFSLQNLPVTTGAQDVRTVLRDAFGRQQSYSIQGYYSAGLLASGYADFSLNAGFQRRNFGTGSFDYGAPAALGSWR